MEEAAIIAQAGRLKSVTVATNMAGRGVDIKLGGNSEFMAKKQAENDSNSDDPKFMQDLIKKFDSVTNEEKEKVIQLGGLYVIGTERHESRRIDNQLRGRSGRQGDPGESRFYISLEDELMRRFQGERIQSIMDKLNLPDDEKIEQSMVTKSIERAQAQVESLNFEIRKNVLKFDQVLNQQRDVIYKWRRELLKSDNIENLIIDWRDDIFDDLQNNIDDIYNQDYNQNKILAKDKLQYYKFLNKLFPSNYSKTKINKVKRQRLSTLNNPKKNNSNQILDTIDFNNLTKFSLFDPSKFNISGINLISLLFLFEFKIKIKSLSNISILTKKLSNFSNPQSNIKFLLVFFLSSKKLRPKVGGKRFKSFSLKIFHKSILNDTELGLNNLNKKIWYLPNFTPIFLNLALSS